MAIIFLHELIRKGHALFIGTGREQLDDPRPHGVEEQVFLPLWGGSSLFQRPARIRRRSFFGTLIDVEVLWNLVGINIAILRSVVCGIVQCSFIQGVHFIALIWRLRPCFRIWYRGSGIVHPNNW